MRLRTLLAAAMYIWFLLLPANADVLDVHAPGLIKDGFGGAGVSTRTVYAPDMGPAFIGMPTTLRSQISEPGGYRVGGDQCSAANFADSEGRPFQWWDTYCEARSGNRSSLCQRRPVHQGLDMVGGTRATCLDNVADDRRGGLAAVDNVPLFAVADGQVKYFGKSFSLDLNADEGVYRYLHLNMAKISVPHGAVVRKGDRIGYMSRDFGGNRTTYHLHLELWKEISGRYVPVPLYLTYAVAQAKHEGKDVRIVESGEIIRAGGIGAGQHSAAQSSVGPARMIASYWKSGNEEFGLVASGNRRVFFSIAASGDAQVYYDGVLTRDDNGNTFYEGRLKHVSDTCGTASVPFSGPVINAALTVSLAGYLPKYEAQCGVSDWEPLTITLTFERRNSDFDSSLVDLGALNL